MTYFPTPTGAEAYYYVVMAVDSDTPGNLSAQPTLPSNPALPQNMAPPGPDSLTGATLHHFLWGKSFLDGIVVIGAGNGLSGFAERCNFGDDSIFKFGTVTYFDNTVPGTGLPVTYIVQATNNFGTTPSNSIFVTVVECNEGRDSSNP